MDLFSNLQLLHEAAISVLVTTTYGRWRTITEICTISVADPEFGRRGPDDWQNLRARMASIFFD